MHPPPTTTTSAVRFIPQTVYHRRSAEAVALPGRRGHLLDLLHHAQDVAAENLLDVGVRVALLDQRIGDLRQLRGVFQSEGHRRAVEVLPQADVIGTGDLDRVIDVLDDLLPAYFRQLA